jgi:hypothetical protein
MILSLITRKEMKKKVIYIQKFRTSKLIFQVSVLLTVIALIGASYNLSKLDYDNFGATMILLFVSVSFAFIFRVTDEGLVYSPKDQKFFLNDIEFNFKPSTPAIFIYESFKRVNSDYRRILNIGIKITKSDYESLIELFSPNGKYHASIFSRTIHSEQALENDVFLYRISLFDSKNDSLARTYALNLGIKLGLTVNDQIITSKNSYEIFVLGIKKGQARKGYRDLISLYRNRNSTNETTDSFEDKFRQKKEETYIKNKNKS